MPGQGGRGWKLVTPKYRYRSYTAYNQFRVDRDKGNERRTRRPPKKIQQQTLQTFLSFSFFFFHPRSKFPPKSFSFRRFLFQNRRRRKSNTNGTEKDRYPERKRKDREEKSILSFLSRKRHNQGSSEGRR